MFDLKKIHLVPFIAVFLSFSIASLMAARSKYSANPSPGQHLIKEPRKSSEETRQPTPIGIEEKPGPPAVGVLGDGNKIAPTPQKKAGEKSSK